MDFVAYEKQKAVVSRAYLAALNDRSRLPEYKAEKKKLQDIMKNRKK